MIAISLINSELKKYLGNVVTVTYNFYRENETREDVMLEVVGRNVRFEQLGWKHRSDIYKIEIKESQLHHPSSASFKMKYRNGKATKKALMGLVDLYYEQHDKRIFNLCLNNDCTGYIWQCRRVQLVIMQFIDWATENHGVSFGDYVSYASPLVGQLKIIV